MKEECQRYKHRKIWLTFNRPTITDVTSYNTEGQLLP